MRRPDRVYPDGEREGGADRPAEVQVTFRVARDPALFFVQLFWSDGVSEVRDWRKERGEVRESCSRHPSKLAFGLFVMKTSFLWGICAEIILPSYRSSDLPHLPVPVPVSVVTSDTHDGRILL